MERIFISSLKIENVRHLNDITIPLSKNEMKHLILTGKNGSGKTSVLEALSQYLNTVATTDKIESHSNSLRQRLIKRKMSLDFNKPDAIRYCFEKGQFILAYYKADRVFEAEVPKHVEKIKLKDK